MEDSFGDIINFVETNYRVKKNKANRAIAGLSMGECILLLYRLNMQIPSITSACFQHPIATMMARNNEESAKYAAEFVKKLQVQQKMVLHLLDAAEYRFPVSGCSGQMKKMDEISFDYTYRESDGGHIWRIWRIYLTEFAPMLFSNRHQNTGSVHIEMKKKNIFNDACSYHVGCLWIKITATG